MPQNQSSNKVSAASSSPNINVTPLIDVLLVLLIIFMVISPRREAQLPVRAPDKSPAAIDPRSSETLMLTVSSEFQLALNRKPLTTAELAVTLKDLMEQRETDGRILFIKAPPIVPYDSIISLLDIAKGSGVMTIGLLAD